MPRLDENIGAETLDLNARDLVAIETAVDTSAIKGSRYDELEMKMVNL